jgi:hypothetical protein
MTTATLAPYANVTVYGTSSVRDEKGRTVRANRTTGNIQLCFATEQDARAWIARERVEHYNLYRIDRVNGTWRTDWEPAA